MQSVHAPVHAWRPPDGTLYLLCAHVWLPSQIVLGVGTYGRTFNLAAPGGDITPGVAIGNGATPTGGECTIEQGVLAWFELKSRIPANEQRIDETALAAYGAYNGGASWAGFDNPESHRLKLCWARQQKLGGVMVWDTGEAEAQRRLLAQPPGCLPTRQRVNIHTLAPDLRPMVRRTICTRPAQTWTTILSLFQI